MISKRNTLWLIPFLLVASFPLWKIPVGHFLAPRGGLDNTAARKKAAEYDFAMTGVTILQSEMDQETARIRANGARSTDITNVYVLEEVDADILDDEGGITHVLADIGRYNALKKQLELSENVVITNRVENYTMETQLLLYDGNKRIVICPEESILHGDGIIIKGASLHHDMNTGAYSVGGRVYCTLLGQTDS